VIIVVIVVVVRGLVIGVALVAMVKDSSHLIGEEDEQ